MKGILKITTPYQTISNSQSMPEISNFYIKSTSNKIK
jgi:hypothetical protein